MLARVSGGKKGVIEYLENGMKSGRELSRDELDERVCIDGNIQLTETIIDELSKRDSPENYYHITLSFSERELQEKTIIDAYNQYKNSLMSAYDKDEFNIYAEIHYPKIKSYTNKKTGDLVERLPHVHIVIPKKNLITNKVLSPFGKYTENIQYFDAIQERINRNLGLISPYDHQRKNGIESTKAEMISRYKGDNFNTAGTSVKKEILERIESENIKSMASFKVLLSSFGEVSIGNKGKPDEYFKIKLPEADKNIRLKEPVFKPSFIENREILRPKPNDNKINRLVHTWINRVSHEIKYIHQASPKLRKQYNDLNTQAKKEYLNDTRQQYFKTINIRERGRKTGHKPSIESIGFKQFSEIPNGLPSMHSSNLDGAEHRKRIENESVLSSNEHDNMVKRKPNRNNQLRRNDINRRYGRRSRERASGFNRAFGYKPLRGTSGRNGLAGLTSEKYQIKKLTYTQQLLADYKSAINNKQDLNYYNLIKKELNPNNLLNYFSEEKGLIKDHYKVINPRGSIPKIIVGNRALTVNDFCTQHMRLSWSEAKEILDLQYRKQLELKIEKNAVNSIASASRFVTERYSRTDKLLRLNESIRILKKLQNKELYGENMKLDKFKTPDVFSQENSISNASLSFAETAENLKRQQALAERLQQEFRMSNLIASKDVKNSRVVFYDKTTGDKSFTDHGDKITMNSRKPDEAHIASAMSLASEKFGIVKLSGSNEFKQKALDIAVTKDLNLVFSDKKLNAQFIKLKTDYTANLARSTHLNNTDKAETAIASNKAPDAPITESVTKPLAEPVTLVKHGSAPYLDDKQNSQSYFVELSNGEKLWGVGLKNAISNSKAKIGDEVDIQTNGQKVVTVPVEIKDDAGKVTHTEQKEVNRNDWKVTVINSEKISSVKEKTEDKKLNEANKSGVKESSVKPKDQEIYEVKYQWSAKENTTLVTINGQKPSDIKSDTLNKIVKNDPFLQTIGVSKVSTGKVDRSLAKNVQPISAIYDKNGKTIKPVVKAKANTQTENKPKPKL